MRTKLICLILASFLTIIFYEAFNIGSKLNFKPFHSQIPTIKENLVRSQYSTNSSSKISINESNFRQHIVNPELNYVLDFKLNPSNLCNESYLSQKLLFAYAIVKPNDYAKRDVIRKTWSNKSYFSKRIKTAFVVGLSSDPKINTELVKEQEIYNDIIQGNFMDSYRNLSYKLLTVWKWSVQYCSNAKYLARVQDDIFMNSFNLIRFLNNEKIFFPNEDYSQLKYFFICRPYKRVSPVKDKSSKHYVTDEEYNFKLYNMTRYPTYCSGPAILMSADLCKELYLKSYDIKVFWIDDIYESMLARHLNPIYVNAKSMFIDANEIKSRQKGTYLFVRVDRTVEQFIQIWNILLKIFQ